MNGKPRTFIEKRVDRSLGGRMVNLEIQSETVKRAARDATSHSANTLLASYEGAVNRVYVANEGTIDKPFRVTRFQLYGDQAQEFALMDRNGTFTFMYLEAAGEIDLLGDQDSPVFVTRGTFNIRMLGSVASGTFACSFEGVVPRIGSETIQ